MGGISIQKNIFVSRYIDRLISEEMGGGGGSFNGNLVQATNLENGDELTRL